MRDRVTAALQQAIAAHVTHVFRRACGALAGDLGEVQQWVVDCARAHPTYLQLPLLACEATDGDPSDAVPVAAAWHLLHCAARILDDVADKAQLPLEADRATNTAVILIFLAQVSLTTLRQSNVDAERIISLVSTFNTATTHTALGQAADLAWDESGHTPDDYLRLAGAKTGEFFALACRCGAMLGTDETTEIDIYSSFGYHLGVLVQLGDDLQALWRPRGRSDLITTNRTLPVVYALTVASSRTRAQLRALVRKAPDDPGSLHQLQSALAKLGALHFTALQAGQQHHLAREAILSSARPTVAQHELLKLLDAAFPAVASEAWSS